MNEKERQYNKERFKSMNKREKVAYIWEYYRVHIVGGLVGLICAVSLVKTVLAPQPEIKTDFLVAGKIQIDYEVFNEYNDWLYDTFEARVGTIQGDFDGMHEMSIINEQLLMVRIAVREADLMLLQESKYKIYAGEGEHLYEDEFEPTDPEAMFYPLDTIEEFDEILALYEEELVYGENEEGEEHVYGIRLGELNQVEGITLVEEMIFSMFAVPKDMENAIEVTKYLLLE